MRRFHFDFIPDKGQKFSIPENKHMTKVLRLTEGDLLEASDGTGQISVLKLISLDSELIFSVIQKTQGKEIPLLGVAFIAEIKAIDEAISLLAEHGIQRIIPFFSERTVSKYDAKQANKKQERRQKLADEAVKKVGGLFSCVVEEGIPFKSLEQKLSPFPQKILFWESEDSPAENLEKVDMTKAYAFLIGAEGGFSPKELDTLQQWGCQSYSLGTRILKAQNAATAASVLFRYLTEKSSR